MNNEIKKDQIVKIIATGEIIKINSTYETYNGIIRYGIYSKKLGWQYYGREELELTEVLDLLYA